MVATVGAVGGEGDAVHHVPVPAHRVPWLAAHLVPDDDGLVGTTGDERAVRAVGERAYRLRVAGQDGDVARRVAVSHSTSSAALIAGGEGGRRPG